MLKNKNWVMYVFPTVKEFFIKKPKPTILYVSLAISSFWLSTPSVDLSTKLLL